MKRAVIQLIAGIAFLICMNAYAQDLEETPVMETPPTPSSAWEQAQDKLKRGAGNVALGWAEVPIGVRHIGEKHGLGAAATWGILHGIGRAVQRTAVGVYEVATFPVPLEGEKPLMEPAYVFEDDATQ